MASKTILPLIGATLVSGLTFAQTPIPTPEGHVTQIIRDVKLLPAQADPRAAAMNDLVDENTGLKTGTDSRSELTFADLTITRLGENTLFSFNRAGRSVRLDSGSILVWARKDSGAAEISTKAVSVGITGTTLIFETTPSGHNKLLMLEGGGRLSLKDHPDQSAVIQGGQLLDVPKGAKKIPAPVNVRIEDIMKTNPLITDFPPLPSQDLISAVIQGQNAPPPPLITESRPSKPSKKHGSPTPAPVVAQPVQPQPAQPQPVTVTTGPGILGFPLGPILYPGSGPTRSGSGTTTTGHGGTHGGWTPTPTPGHIGRGGVHPTPTPYPRRIRKKPTGGPVIY